jgi:hypothetical protein
MFADGNLPSVLHWTFMLRGAARAGCPKTFARFHDRLQRKVNSNNN